MNAIRLEGRVAEIFGNRFVLEDATGRTLVETGPRGERAQGADRVERSFSPKAACIDMVARRIGDRAYVKARLELKPEQMTAWTAFEKAADEASAKSMARCQTLPAEMKERPGYVERLTMEEDMMKARIALSKG